MDIDEYLKKLYYNKSNIVKTEKELYDIAKADGYKITHNKIKEFLKNQEINQVFYEHKKPEKFTSIFVDGIRDEYQLDLMIYDRYEYHKYKYILVVVDIYSRYALAKALTNRENPNIIKNIEEIFKVMGKPRKISCDNEFDTIEFRKY
jgi:hypothetical protein